MIEKVARALFDRRPHNNWIKGVQQVPDWEKQPEHIKDVFRGDARAALEAMREPSSNMLNAAVDLTGAGSDMDWSNRSPQQIFREAWFAMIEAALEPRDGE